MAQQLLRAVLVAAALATRAAAQQFAITNIEGAVNGLAMSWSASAERYIAAASSDLLTGAFQYVGPVLTTNETFLPLAGGATNCFYRVRKVAVLEFPDPGLRQAVWRAIPAKYSPTNDIYDVDVESITNLNARSSGITSATGIGQLKNLVTLDIGWNALSGIDVRGLAKLENLDCRYNHNLTNVNVSGCSLLQTLDVYDNNLTRLDLSGCGNLKKLWITQNPFTSLEDLNVTGCTNLQTLWCYTPGLTNLNITGCTNLLNLYADGSPISDLSSLLTLAAHGGLATNAYVNLVECPLTDYAKNVQMPILWDTYGVTVEFEPSGPYPAWE